MKVKISGPSGLLLFQPEIDGSQGWRQRVWNLSQQFEGRRGWRNRDFVFEATRHNLDVLSANGVEVPPQRESPVDDILAAAEIYQQKTTPFPHQREALTRMLEKPHFALLMEQGTGKTKVTLDWLGILHTAGRVTGCIVVSKKGVHRQWVEEQAPQHLGVDFVGGWWPLKKKDHAHIERGRGKFEMLAYNYDGIKTAKGMMAAKAFAARHKGKLAIVLDESQEIKNARSQRHKALMELQPLASFRSLATGTPIAKDLTDQWAQFRWLNEDIIGIRYVTTFRRTYCLMGGYEGKQVIGHQNLPRFVASTEPFSFRATKADIGIEAAVYDRWRFDMTKEQRAHIKQLKQHLETELESGRVISAANAVVALTKFQQVSSGFLMDEDGDALPLMGTDDNPRVQAMLEWIDQREDEKAVVWFRYRAEAPMIMAALGAAGLEAVQYHGGINEADRAAAVERFNNGGAQVFVANAQTAGTGLNLQISGCTRALYFSNSFAALDRWQSEARIHRIGTKGIVSYTDLIAKGGLDRHIIDNLSRKKGLSDLVLDDLRQMVKSIGDDV